MIRKSYLWLRRFRGPFICNERNLHASPRHTALYFGISLVFFWAYVLVLQWDWILSGQMVYEMATDFVPTSHADSLWVRFFKPDAGYIPLLMRVVAWSFASFRVDLALIPYFYTGSALFLVPFFVAPLCLPIFRVLIPSDALRFIVCLVVLWLSSTEILIFLNCSYYFGFFVLAVSALAWVLPDERELPWWAWGAVLAALSKPLVLATAPGVLLVALVRPGRFSRIGLVCLFLSLLQCASLAYFAQQGVMSLSRASDANTFIQGVISIPWSLVLLAANFVGVVPARALDLLFSPDTYVLAGGLMAAGAVLLGLAIGILRKRPQPSSALILFGLLGLFFHTLLACVALSRVYTPDFSALHYLNLSKWSIVGFWSVLFVLIGFLGAMRLPATGLLRRLRVNQPILFALWFLCSGLVIVGPMTASIPHLLKPKLVENEMCEWRTMAERYDILKDPNVCFPVEGPYGTVYPQEALLNTSAWNSQVLDFEPEAVDSLPLSLEALPSGSALLGIVIPFKASSGVLVQGEAVITLKDGRTVVFRGQRALRRSGGTLFLHQASMLPIALADIESIDCTFSQPVFLGVSAPRELISYGGDVQPAFTPLWLGIPSSGEKEE